MMLPEHKQALIEQSISLRKQPRPELTEEEQQEMFGKLRMSMKEHLEVMVTVFGEYENSHYTGVITGLDPHQYLVKIKLNHDWKVIDFKDIVGVEF
ncbi:YolD-like family protein [Paenibacillus filicis]|uniref:YolD-like family protein n=1 Tax=Paenibacillus gyeongsangnamensis TaxID=3388067 RepID=A0ABT4QAM4_9BACL|nr:YolD-like family protein [Paenibacillus filicis]MCZ8513802.1 YolD-like family protein [Paenibacillus filicis]